MSIHRNILTKKISHNFFYLFPCSGYKLLVTLHIVYTQLYALYPSFLDLLRTRPAPPVPSVGGRLDCPDRPASRPGRGEPAPCSSGPTRPADRPAVPSPGLWRSAGGWCRLYCGLSPGCRRRLFTPPSVPGTRTYGPAAVPWVRIRQAWDPKVTVRVRCT